MKIRIVYLFTNLDIRGIIELFCCCKIRIIMFFLSDAQLFSENLIISFRCFTEELYSSQPLRRAFLELTRPSSVLFPLFVALNFSVALSLTSSALALSISTFLFLFSDPVTCSSSAAPISYKSPPLPRWSRSNCR